MLRKYTGDSGTVTIGDISLSRRAPKNPELVPVNYGMYWYAFKTLIITFKTSIVET